LYLAELPHYMHTALERLSEEMDWVGKFSKRKCERTKLRTFLRKMIKLRVYGFNAGKV